MKRFVLLALVLVIGIGAKHPTIPTYFHATPLVDFTPSTPRYLGQFAGNLYDGSNDPPADYAAYAQGISAGIVPLDGIGNPSPNGKIGLLSIGVSNSTLFWCGTRPDCSIPVNNSFMYQAAASPSLNHTTLTILNGAEGKQNASRWTCAYGPCVIPTNQYDRVRDTVLTPNGLTEAQVQVVWMQNADFNNYYFLPDSRAEAYVLEAEFGATVRAIHTRWPNVRMIVHSDLNYTGYAGTATVQGGTYAPIEPFAYEGGFAIKWLVAAKIAQWRTGAIDPIAGDLSGLPVLTWGVGSYLWGSDSQNPPNSLALAWAKTDLSADFIHPSLSGIQHAASRLLSFFTSDPETSPWFLAH